MGLYRPTVIRKRPDGTRRREKSSLWWGKYYDHARGKYVAVPLKTADKSAAKIVFNRVQRDAATEADRPFAKYAKRPLTEHIAAYAKAGDDDTLPLRPATATALAAWRDEHGPLDPQTQVFAMPHVANLAVMLRFDLDPARKAWIDAKGLAATERKRRERSDFLEYRNQAGAVADFHSLRHTFGTNLARAGVHPKLAQDLMRHADINLTMNLYTHTLLVDRSQAVAGLPEVAISNEAATDAA